MSSPVWSLTIGTYPFNVSNYVLFLVILNYNSARLPYSVSGQYISRAWLTSLTPKTKISLRKKNLLPKPWNGPRKPSDRCRRTEQGVQKKPWNGVPGSEAHKLTSTSPHLGLLPEMIEKGRRTGGWYFHHYRDFALIPSLSCRKKRYSRMLGLGQV